MVIDLQLADARAILHLMGEHGPPWITERIGAFASAGNRVGMMRFQQIALRYQQLVAMAGN